jgi:hypothetical protein
MDWLWLALNGSRLTSRQAYVSFDVEEEFARFLLMAESDHSSAPPVPYGELT